MGKGKNAHYQHFLLFPQYFQMPTLRVKSLQNHPISSKNLKEGDFQQHVGKGENTGSHFYPFHYAIYYCGKYFQIGKV